MSKIVDYVIVISSDATESELRAAAFVRDNVRLVCGRLLPIVRDSRSPSNLEIVVGETSREKLDGLRFDRYREPGTGGIWEYVVKSVGSRLYLTGLGFPPQRSPSILLHTGILMTAESGPLWRHIILLKEYSVMISCTVLISISLKILSWRCRRIMNSSLRVKR